VPVFQAGEGVLDPAALLIELAVVSGGAVSSTAGGDADPNASGFQFVAQPVGIVALVADQPLGGREFCQQHQGAFGVAHLTWREEEGQRSASSVADHVQLGVQAALGAADRAQAEPPFERLAAVRCAFRCVLSIMIVSPSTPG